MKETSPACRRAPLRGYVLGTLSDVEKRQVESHLAICTSCRRVVHAAGTAANFNLRSLDLKQRVKRAAAAVDELEKGPKGWHAVVCGSDWGADPYVAGRLLERSREEFSRDPRASLSLARAAIWIAERGESPVLQFEGWRDCVGIFVRLGQYANAWDSIDRADAIAARTDYHEHARGLLLYARAYVGSQPDVWKIDEALQWIDDASKIFERTDSARLRASAEMRAYIHYCRGEYAAAVEICRKLWHNERELGLSHSFASYLVGYGQPNVADDVLRWAKPRVDKRDTVTIARHDFVEGRVRLAQQRWEEAIDAFARAAAAFRRVGMHDTAIRVDLGRIHAEVSVAPDSDAACEKAIRNLRHVVNVSAELDRQEPTRRRRFTVEGIDYLREMAEASALSVDLFGHVEEYVDSITRGPARPFVRPVPARLM